jgi:opacity protein-like surface antigen
MKKRLLALGMMLLSASPLFAADIDGNWTGSIDTPNGAVEVKFSFKAEADKLTGNSTGPDGMTLQFRDGKIMGDTLSFAQDLDFGGQTMTLNYTGVLAGSELKLHTEFGGQPLDFALKKVL